MKQQEGRMFYIKRICSISFGSSALFDEDIRKAAYLLSFISLHNTRLRNLLSHRRILSGNLSIQLLVIYLSITVDHEIVG